VNRLLPNLAHNNPVATVVMGLPERPLTERHQWNSRFWRASLMREFGSPGKRLSARLYVHPLQKKNEAIQESKWKSVSPAQRLLSPS
jgi:hypothetical protein